MFFMAPERAGHPFFRSYGARLPSSLTRFHSRAWVYSTHPPVSDSGTGNRGNTRKFFSVPALMDPLQPRPPRPRPALSNDSKIIEGFQNHLKVLGRPSLSIDGPFLQKRHFRA